MATTETIYRGSNGKYYTAAGLADLQAYGTPPTSYTKVEATRYTVTFHLMDAAAGVLFNTLGSATGVSTFTRREGDKTVTYRTDNGATSGLVIPVYKVNGSGVTVYGAHPSNPGMGGFYSNAAPCVVFKSANAKRYRFNGAYTVAGDDLEHVAPNLASGSEYNANKIIYSNANNLIIIGANVAPLDGSLFVYAGYYWFLGLSQNAVTLTTSANTNTRTVANGKKYAAISEISLPAGTAQHPRPG